MAEKLVRFGVTVPKDIVEEFDRRLEQAGRHNRSDVLRQLMRGYITEERWREEEGEVFGTVTLMYDHHAAFSSKDLAAAQHDHGDVIVCTTHVHVTHETCLECIVLRGSSAGIRAFVNALSQIRGIKSMDTVITSGI